MINLLIVDDEKLIREGLKILLSVNKDINVVGLCSHGLEAVQKCKECDVDVVLMDIRMEKCDGVLGTKYIKALNKDIKVVILTTFKDDEYIKSALAYGASGYILKDSSSEKIYETIRSAYVGNVVVDNEIADIVFNDSTLKDSGQKAIKEFNLTNKELDIIRLIAEGLSNKEIGEKLYLTEGTIKNNISKILSKLFLRDRTQIAIFAYKNNLMND